MRKPRVKRAASVFLLGLLSFAAFLLSSGRLRVTSDAELVGPKIIAPVIPELRRVSEAPLFLDVSDLPDLRLRAAAGILYNPKTHEVLWATHGLEQRPMASITKVMTALVFLHEKRDLSRDVVISRSDVRRASTTYLRRGERVSLKDLLHLALIASDNAAARVLARVSPWGTVGFVDQMNHKAAELGFDDTSFVDSSGLDERNLSTAYDLARLIAYASEDPTISRIMRKQSYGMSTSRRRLRVRNTNRLLQGRHVIHGGKTGYIDEAGYCVAAVVKLPGSDPLALVVLGARSNSGRFAEARRLVNWVSTDGRSLITLNMQRAD